MPDTLDQPQSANVSAAASPSQPAACVDQVSFTYPKADKPALDGVSFDLPQGQMLALLGPNGSGKTTLFKLLTGMIRLPVTQGQLQLFGQSPLSNTARADLGVVFQSPSLDPNLTVFENLIAQAKLYGMSGKLAKDTAEHWASQLAIQDKLQSPAGKLSGGQKRRVELAKALMHGPRLVLMDEPSTGLDPVARRQLWDQIETLRQNATAAGQPLSIIVTTHLMDEAEACDAAVLMHQGKLVAQGTPGSLRQSIPGQLLRVAPNQAQDADSLCQAVTTHLAQAVPGFDNHPKPTVAGGIVRWAHEDAANQIPSIAQAFEGRIREIAVGHATLDDVFMHLTGTSLAAKDL